MRWFWVILFLNAIILSAQQKCLVRENSNLKIDHTASRSEETLYIPTVVHVFHRGDASEISLQQIQSQIDVLNWDFNQLNKNRNQTPEIYKWRAGNSNLVFFLARRDPNGNCHSGVNYINSVLADHDFNDTRKLTARSMWNPSNYLNIYVVKSIDGNGNDILGYAQEPGLDSTLDAVVIKHSAFGTTGTATTPFHLGRTTTHEVGHWMGLKHIWGAVSAVGSFCNADDGQEDTPNQSTANYGTPTHPSKSCSNNGDMFMNFMDYSNDSVMTLFTKDQTVYLRSVLNSDSARSRLISNRNPAQQYRYSYLLEAQGNSFCDTSLLNYHFHSNIHESMEWQLMKNEAIIHSGNTSKFSYPAQDRPTFIQFITSDSCQTDTITRNLEIYSCLTEIQEPIKKEDFHIHNNHIHFASNNYRIIQVYSSTGQLIFQMETSLKTVQLPLEKGIYILHVKSKDQHLQRRFFCD